MRPDHHDLVILRAAGAPLAVDRELGREPTPAEVMETLARVVEHPQPRLIDAAAVGCVFLARHLSGELAVLGVSDAGKRRLGYMLEVLGQQLPEHPVLARWAAALAAEPTVRDEPLSLAGACTTRRLQRLSQQASALQRKWGVYAAPGWTRMVDA
ncbi:MAG: hypothetical protein KC492_33415 [Myxococcales bacterium]|nr:hypothetical protein [Myxococcales bacterium]